MTRTTEPPGRRPLADFSAVYRDHSRAVLIFLTRRTYDPELAMDLTAETFAQALSSQRRFRGQTVEDERAWLFGIAHHVLSRSLRRAGSENRALRRLGLERPQLDGEDFATIVELAGLSELRSAVAIELQQLSDKHRDAVRLRVVEELGYDEVARRLEISEPAARARVSRGLRALARALEQTLPYTETIG